MGPARGQGREGDDQDLTCDNREDPDAPLPSSPGDATLLDGSGTKPGTFKGNIGVDTFITKNLK